MFCKGKIRREYGSLIISRPCWHKKNKILNKNPTAKKFLDQKMRASSFETRNERTVTGTSVKKQKQTEINQRRMETRILLSMEGKRKVYERRRMQFPPR